jgi:hypothetical protein
VQIIIEHDHNGIMFRDALYLADDHAYTDAEIDAMKQERISNWVLLITSPQSEFTLDEEGE